MKKSLLFLLGVFLFAIMLGRVYHDDIAMPGDYFEVFATYHNQGDSKASNLKVSLYIPDLGVYYRTNTFDLASGDNGGRYLLPYVPKDAESGWHRVWLMISGDNQRDYMFDWVYVK